MAGTSNWQNISYCVNELRRLQPGSVLDVGAGFGRWGVLCREFLDVWNDRPFPKDWRVHLAAIEAYPENISPLYDYIYDDIIPLPMWTAFLDMKRSYDLIIFGDVLEHVLKPEAVDIMEKAFQHTNKAIMINLPIGPNWPQGAKYNNGYELHRSIWEMEDLSLLAHGHVGNIRVFKDYLDRTFATCVYSTKLAVDVRDEKGNDNADEKRSS